MKGRMRFVSLLTASLLLVWSIVAVPFGRQIQAQSRVELEAITDNNDETFDLNASKLSRDLRALIDKSRGNNMSAEMQDVIVQTSGTSLAAQIAAIRRQGGRVKHTFRAVDRSRFDVSRFCHPESPGK